MKKPRHITIEVKFAPDVAPTKLVVGPNREVRFEDGKGEIIPESGVWVFAYDRNNKPLPKKLGMLELDPAMLHSDYLMVFQKYDGVIAIDTNTKQIRGGRVSVGCAVQGTLNFDNLPQVTGSYWPTACFEFRNSTIPPERVLWEMILRGVERSESYKTISSVGVIVDSELGAISGLNSRSKPVRGSFYVPEKCELIYASADKGTEWLGYHMIKTCDKIASCALGAIESDASLDSGLLISRGNVYEKYRAWRISLSKQQNNVSVSVSPPPSIEATGLIPA